MLTQQPGLAHRFYTDGSSLTNAVAGALGVTVYGQTAINEKIMSLDLENAIVEVTSVDAQYSLRGGVAVLVTGHMTKVVNSNCLFISLQPCLTPSGQLHSTSIKCLCLSQGSECISYVGKGA